SCMIEQVTVNGKQVVLVGTAHVSDQSVTEVEEAIEEFAPDRICVELDASRLQSLRDQEAWKGKDITDAIAEGDGYMLLFNIVLSIYQRRLGEEYNIEPGAEMLEAIQRAEEGSIPFSLIDRDINITLKRALNRLSVLEKARLVSSVVEGFFESEEIDVEELKEQDILHEVITEFAGRFPSLKEVLIDERDSYMAQRIMEAEGETIVAVVGAGHIDGIRAHLQEQREERFSIDDLEAVDQGRNWFTVIRYAFPALIIGVFFYGLFNLGTSVAREMLFYWFALNGSFAAVGAFLAFAHPVTVAVSFIAAPFTSVNPAVPAGLVAAYAENMFRPPRVEDMESLGEIARFGDLWHNRATKLLLVFMLVNLGSAIATFLGAGVLLKLSGLLF
ncbi:MAG: TraB/GumN family protein, partial [Candidatus Nanohaloarchaea archaeon]|nr:TraB/GumN family protein [Candidatus Nanohaloarchaea archaeon]